MNSSNYKREEGRVILDIKELLWRMLEQWKTIVAFIIIFSLLFLVATYVIDNNAPKHNGEETVLTPEQQLEQLSDTAKNKVLTAQKMNKLLNRLYSYVADAPLMQINPKNCKSLVSLWSIKSEEGLYGSINGIYSSDSIKYEVAESLSNELENEYTVKDLADLIEIKTEGSDNSCIVTVIISIPQDVKEEQLKDAVTVSLEVIETKYEQLIGGYSTDLLSFEVIDISNSSISEKQIKVYSEISSTNSLRKLAVDGLNAEQKTIYNNLISGKDMTINQDTSAPLFSMKRLVLGMILGFVIYLAVLLWRVLSGGKVQSPSHVEDLFGISNLGECYPKKEKTLIDSALCDYNIVKRRHKGYTDINKNSSEAGETIAAILRRGDKSSVVLISSLNARDYMKEYTEALKKELTDKGLTVSEASIDSKNGSSVGEDVLMSYDGVVMLVDKKESSLKDIKDICNKCDYCSVPLLGAVYVG